MGAMKNETRAGAAVLAFMVFAGAAWGEGVTATVKGGYFFPSDRVFRDVYEGGAVFGGDVSFGISGPLHFWAGAEYFAKTGLTTLIEEETKVRIVPLYAGLRGVFGTAMVRPYIGAAAAYFLFREENPLGTVSDGGLGFLGQAGILVRIGGALSLDAFVGYRACTLRAEEPDEEPLTANLGGLSAGLGLAFRF